MLDLSDHMSCSTMTMIPSSLGVFAFANNLWHVLSVVERENERYAFEHLVWVPDAVGVLLNFLERNLKCLVCPYGPQDSRSARTHCILEAL